MDKESILEYYTKNIVYLVLFVVFKWLMGY